ncbi:glycosyltransferase family 2 protein [Vibrio breoganii]
MIDRHLVSEYTDKKIIVAAIAKNESPYFYDWIFHHLYFGFNNIIIGVNRTDDSSKIILEKIQSYFGGDRITILYLDFIDRGFEELCPTLQLQHISYSFIFDYVARHFNAEYLMFLDIDEFWFPFDFKTKIGHYLAQYNNFEVMSFNWLYQDGEETEFTPPFGNTEVYPGASKYDIVNSVKSIIRVSAIDNIIQFRAHCPLLKDKDKHIDSLGNKFDYLVEGGQEPKNDVIISENSAYILHRIKRSPIEFIATLVESRFHESAPVKINPNSTHRDSYSSVIEVKKTLLDNNEAMQLYKSTYENILEHLGPDFYSKLLIARSERKESSLRFIPSDPSLLRERYRVYISKSYGTSFFNLICDTILNNEICTDRLRDMSRFVEVYSKHYAFKFIKKAYLHKRKAPFIRKRLIALSREIKRLENAES